MSLGDERLLDFLVSLEEWTGRTVRLAREIGRERLLSDWIAQLALAKAVEQCGEVAGQILRRWPDFAAAHPEIALRRAVDMRNRIAHGYGSLNFDLIWLTATVSIPQMREAVRAILAPLASNEP